MQWSKSCLDSVRMVSVSHLLLKIQVRRSGIIITGCQIYKSSDQLSYNKREFTSWRSITKPVKPRLLGEYVANSGFTCCYWKEFLAFGLLERGEVKKNGICTPSEIKRILNVKLYFSCLRMMKMIFVLRVGESVGICLPYVLMSNLYVLTYLKSEGIKKKGGGSSSDDIIWTENMLGSKGINQRVKGRRNLAYDVVGNGCKRSEKERSKEFEVGNGNRRKLMVETDIHKTVVVRNSKILDQMADATSIATVGEANTKNQQSGTAIWTDLGGMFFLLGFTFGSVYSEYKWAPVKICDSRKISNLGVQLFVISFSPLSSVSCNTCNFGSQFFVVSLFPFISITCYTWRFISNKNKMRVISWNVQGISNKETEKHLHDLVTTQSPDLIFLMETKCKTDKMEQIAHRMIFYNHACIDRVGLACGLILMWKDNINCDVVATMKNVIHVLIKLHPAKPEVFLSCMYGFVYTDEKKDQWNFIHDLSENVFQPWLLIGDSNFHFNSSVDFHKDKWIQEKVEFSGLMDIGFEGKKIILGLAIDMALGLEKPNWIWLWGITFGVRIFQMQNCFI